MKDVFTVKNQDTLRRNVQTERVNQCSRVVERGRSATVSGNKKRSREIVSTDIEIEIVTMTIDIEDKEEIERTTMIQESVDTGRKDIIVITDSPRDRRRDIVVTEDTVHHCLTVTIMVDRVTHDIMNEIIIDIVIMDLPGEREVHIRVIADLDKQSLLILVLDVVASLVKKYFLVVG